jgi:MFS family permease
VTTEALSRTTAGQPESTYAWLRLVASLLLGTIGGVGMWSVVVAIPAVQADFGGSRGDASLAYTLTMLGAATGGIVMGKVADRFGAMVVSLIAASALGIGYFLSANAQSLTQFALMCGVIGLLGASAVFGPLMADASLWFTRHRGLAVAIVASGSYLAGTLWPPVVEHFIADYGWRRTQLGIAVFCLATMLPLALLLWRRSPGHGATTAHAARASAAALRGVPPNVMQTILVVAGVACCVAMSMPQVHIVAYCIDLGYGPARGAEMLSIMLGCGIVSRLASGWIADRIGGPATLLLGSALQASALMLYVPFDGLASLYLISALFGLVQGGIVPSYGVIVRGLFPPGETGFRLGLVLTATMAGMALGGWLSGVIYDLTGSYRAAFLNGFGWNLLNAAIAIWLLRREIRQPVLA